MRHESANRAEQEGPQPVHDGQNRQGQSSSHQMNGVCPVDDEIDFDRCVAGCVIFDDPGNPTTGWASIAGRAARRIRSQGDLNSSLVWVSNLSFQEAMEAHVSVRVRHSNFLSVRINRVAWEMGFDLRDDPMEAAQAVAEIANRVCRIVQRYYHVTTFENTLVKTISKCILKPTMDPPLSRRVLPIVEEAFLSLQRVSGRIDPGRRLVPFAWPPQLHARVVMSFPVPDGQWEHKRTSLPRSVVDTKEYLIRNSRERGGFARIDVSGIPPEMAGLMDVVTGHDGAREWLPLPEAAYLSAYGQVRIKEVVLSEGLMIPSQQAAWQLPDFGPEAEMSYSAGMVYEAHWVALATAQWTTGSGHNRRRSCARASVMRAWDRMLCMRAAMDFNSEGLHVLSYGTGCVNIAGSPGEMKKAATIAKRNDILTNLSIIDEIFSVNEGGARA